MSEGRVYVAPIGGGEWTDVGYIAEVEWATPPAELTVGSHAPRSLAATTTLTLRPDDGRDQPMLPDVTHLRIKPPAVDGGPVVGLLPQNLIVHGIYQRCDRCQAPAVEPFPAGWRLDVHVAERGGRIAFTPHRPDCDTPTLGHVMPGVKLLNMDPLFGLAGIPIAVDPTLPAGTWRVLDHDGNVLHEGAVTP